MYTLGIIDSQNDCGAALLKGTKIVFAIDEERIVRKKMIGGFPSESVKKIFEITKIKPSQIEKIIVGGILTPPLFTRLFRKLQKIEYDIRSKRKNDLKTYLSDFAQFKLKIHVIPPSSFSGRIQRIFLDKVFRKSLPKNLQKKPLVFIDHHLAHAASAYYTSGKEKVLCITADGCGDGLSLTINICDEGTIKRIFHINAVNSYGWFYGLVTLFLGFLWHKHEGKVTGLAAYGNAKNVKVSFPFKFVKGKITYSKEWGRKGLRYLKENLSDYKKEDIAAWLQKNIEEHITKLISAWIKKTKIYDIVLAGGLFANVKLNQRINEIPEIKSLYIFPHMGDGGLAVGAILASLKPLPYELENAYFGPAYSNAEIKKELDKVNIKYKYCKNIEKEIAKLLAEGKVVARFNGRMEYGPRALGNRSILYQATDPIVNDWLNKKLKRTEFMPFAPTTLIEYANKCYKGIKGAKHAAKFMTITFDCTNWMKKRCPGVVHVDGTARPQLLSKKENPSFYVIIDEYRKITGLPSIINTSFNMHEEPIVCTPEDAIRAFKLGHLDYLAIGNYLVGRGHKI